VFQELHVDGGAVSQAFLIPPASTQDGPEGVGLFEKRPASAYIIRNSRLTTEWSDVEKKLLPIAAKPSPP